MRDSVRAIMFMYLCLYIIASLVFPAFVFILLALLLLLYYTFTHIFRLIAFFVIVTESIHYHF